MKTSNTIAALALFVAFGASGASVSIDDATLAARGWLSRAGVSAYAVSAAASAVRHTTTNGASFYTVRSSFGTVFTSGDTADEPIIGFTTATEDFSSIDATGPLWAMLNRDVSAMQSARSVVQPLAAKAALAATSSATGNAARWAALRQAGEEVVAYDSVRAPLAAAAIKSVTGLDDVRVPALVQSKWSQDTAQGKACYNYYTPNGSNPKNFTPGNADNAVCGCVATAISQVMRYFRYPTASVAAKTFECTWAASEKSATTSMNLTMQGGSYDWDAMPLEPADGTLTDENRMAIGKLTSDAGIASHMGYTPSGSGAFGSESGGTLCQTFGYKNAVCFMDGEDLAASSGKRLTILQHAMFANFDAGLPVLVNIPGHAVLADGYGYADGVDYVHFNMGWAGSCDFWYNIPDLTKAGSAFNVVDEVIYNIYTNAPSTSAVMSGRVVDDDGKAVAGAAVRVYAAGDQTAALAEATTDAHGVWGVVLEEGTYDIDVASDGRVSDRSGIRLVAPSTKPFKWSNGFYTFDKVTGSSSESLGNSWGNDVVLKDPTVRIVRGVETNEFSCLEKALAFAESGDAVEIVKPTKLRANVLLDVSCTIFGAGADSSAWSVERIDDAAIAVTNGATLTVSNVTFAGSSATCMTVYAGSRLALGGDVDFGMTIDDEAAVSVGDASGFELIALPTFKFWLSSSAVGADECFGSWSGATVEEMAAAAGLVRNANDPDGYLGGKAENDGSLIWVDAGLAVEDSVGYFVSDGAKTNAYRNIDTLVTRFTSRLADVDAGELVLRQTNVLSVGLSIADGKRVTIRGENGAKVILANADVQFVLTDGSLVVENVVFSDYSGPALFYVDGADAALTLGEGLVIENATATDMFSPALTVNSGSATLTGGAVIRDCISACANPRQGGWGAGVTVKRNGHLNLAGATITNCFASTCGGGVFAQIGSNITISGHNVIAGNTSESEEHAADDIYLYDGTNPTATGTVDGIVGVKRSPNGSVGDGEGSAFLSIADGVSADDAMLSTFVNDRFDNLSAGVSSDGKTLVWSVTPVAPVTADEAVARIVDAYGVTTYYRTLADAMNGAKENETVELTANATLDEDIEITNAVTLCSVAGEAFGVSRTADCTLTVAAGGSLSVLNLTMSGGEATKPLLLVKTDAKLVLGNGVVVCDVVGDGNRAANAITVWGGTLALGGGATIRDCANNYAVTGDSAGCAGAIVADGGEVHLGDCTITGCSGANVGGVVIANGATVEVEGEVRIAGNVNLDGKTANMCIEKSSALNLIGALSDGSSIGITKGVQVTNDVFGAVSSSVPTEKRDGSAACFFNDENNAVGEITEAEGKTLLVWGEAPEPPTPPSADPIPALPASPTDDSVKEALASINNGEGLVDKSLAAAITNSNDLVSAYNSLKEWAGTVDGGEAAVVASAYAGVSQEFGVTELFTQMPDTRFTAVEPKANGALAVTVRVTEGEDPHAVASSAVAKLFQWSEDLVTWHDCSEANVTDVSNTTSDEVSFKVIPGPTTGSSAFLRLKY